MADDITLRSQQMGLQATQAAGQFTERGAENASQQIASLPGTYLQAQRAALENKALVERQQMEMHRQQVQDTIAASDLQTEQLRRQEIAQKVMFAAQLNDLGVQSAQVEMAKEQTRAAKLANDKMASDIAREGQPTPAEALTALMRSPEWSVAMGTKARVEQGPQGPRVSFEAPTPEQRRLGEQATQRSSRGADSPLIRSLVRLAGDPLSTPHIRQALSIPSLGGTEEDVTLYIDLAEKLMRERHQVPSATEFMKALREERGR